MHWPKGAERHASLEQGIRAALGDRYETIAAEVAEGDREGMIAELLRPESVSLGT